MVGWIRWLAGAATPSADARRDAWLGLAIVLPLVALFWGVEVVGASGPKADDAFELYYPDYHWIYSQLAEGTLPLWNPYQLCGIPTLGTLQRGILYPPHVLYVLLPTHVAMAASSLLHLALIAGTVLALGLRLRLAPAAAVLGALLVATRGAQPGHVLNSAMQESGAWLALGFLGVLDLLERRTGRGAAWIALATAMSLLAGFPQLTAYAAYSWGFVLLLVLLLRAPDRRQLPLAVGALLAGGALGAAMAAVAILPGLELATVGGRVRGTLPVGEMFPFGAVGMETPLRALGTALAGRPSMPGVAFTFGWTGLVLLPALVLARRRRLAIALAALGLITLLIAMGPSTPFFDLYLLLPEVGTFRNPWRILYVTDLCLALAAGLALDGLLARLRGPGARTRRAEQAAGGSHRPYLAAAVAAGAVVLALVELLLAPPNTRRMPYDADDPMLAPYHAPREALASIAASPDRIWTWLLGDMNELSEKLASLHGVRSLSDYEILTLGRQREYFTWLYWGSLAPDAVNTSGHSQRTFYGYYSMEAAGLDPAGVASRSRLAELAAARFLLVPRSAIAAPPVRSYLSSRGLRPVDLRDRRLVIFEQPDALPRAYLAHDVAAAPPVAELLDRLSRPDYDPRVLSYVETGTDPLPAVSRGGGPERVRILRDELHLVELDVKSGGHSLLVLADSFHPGWIAELDGERVPIHPTNHLFRGVVVPPGPHTVVFRYRPLSVYLGAAVSVAGWLAFGALAWRSRSTARERDAGASAG